MKHRTKRQQTAFVTNDVAPAKRLSKRARQKLAHAGKGFSTQRADPSRTLPMRKAMVTKLRAQFDELKRRMLAEVPELLTTVGNTSTVDIDDAAAAADTQPSQAQIDAGNYRHGHVRIQGLAIAIETAKGVKRKPHHDKLMAAHYGYIKRTEGNDGDHVDVFIGPHPDRDKVWVIDQRKGDAFDEHKVMLGFTSKHMAVQAYKDSYSDGWPVGDVTELTMDQFKRWLREGDTGKPMAGQTINQTYLPFDDGEQVGWFPVNNGMMRGSYGQPVGLVELEDVRQDNHWRCGPSIVTSVLLKLGFDAKEDGVSKELGTTEERSTDPKEIVKLFLRRGCQVEARSMTLADLSHFQEIGWPVIVCVQDYMGRRSAKAEFQYGHYLGVEGRMDGHYVFAQDPSLENWASVSADDVPGGDVPQDKQQSANIDAPGKIMVKEDRWLDVWHDVGWDGTKYVRFGIAVGRPMTVNANPNHDEAGKFASSGAVKSREMLKVDVHGFLTTVVKNPTKQGLRNWLTSPGMSNDGTTVPGKQLKGIVDSKGDLCLWDALTEDGKDLHHDDVSEALGDGNHVPLYKRFELWLKDDVITFRPYLGKSKAEDLSKAVLHLGVVNNANPEGHNQYTGHTVTAKVLHVLKGMAFRSLSVLALKSMDQWLFEQTVNAHQPGTTAVVKAAVMATSKAYVAARKLTKNTDDAENLHQVMLDLEEATDGAVKAWTLEWIRHGMTENVNPNHDEAGRFTSGHFSSVTEKLIGRKPFPGATVVHKILPDGSSFRIWHKGDTVKLDFAGPKGNRDKIASTLQVGSIIRMKTLLQMVKAYHDEGFKIEADPASEHHGEVYSRMLAKLGLKNEAGTFIWNAATHALDAFQTWLKKQVKSLVTSRTQEQLWDDYIQSGFRKGAGRAFDDVRKPYASSKPMDFYNGSKEEFLRSSFGQPVAKDKVRIMSSQTFDELEGITDEMSVDMGRVMTDGLVQGKHPDAIAKDLVDEVDITQRRAEIIAQHRMMTVHNEGQLIALEGLGVEKLGVDVEFTTADDERVCELCADLEGEEFDIEDAHGVLPYHIGCRCCWRPAGPALNVYVDDLRINANPNHDALGRFAKSDLAKGAEQLAKLRWDSKFEEATALQKSLAKAHGTEKLDAAMDAVYKKHFARDAAKAKVKFEARVAKVGLKKFHGTTSEALASIAEHGLKAGIRTGADRWAVKTGMKSPDSVNIGERAECAYMTSMKGMAKTYAEWAVEQHGGKAVILEIHVPAKHISKLKPDELGLDEFGDVRYPGTIPKEWIVNLDKLMVKHVRNARLVNVYAVVHVSDSDEPIVNAWRMSVAADRNTEAAMESGDLEQHARAALAHLKAAQYHQGIISNFNPNHDELGRFSDGSDGQAGGRDVGRVKGVGRRVASEAGRSSDAAAREGRQNPHRPAGQEAAVDPALAGVNDRLDRYAKVFKAKGNDQAAEFMAEMKEHISSVGTERALEALGEAKSGNAGRVQYEGADDELGDTAKEGEFIRQYLQKAGVNLVGQNTELSPDMPHVSTWSEKNLKEQGRPERTTKAGDYLAKDASFANDKLQEAKLLHGDDKAEDVSKLMGKPVTHLDKDTISSLDEKYGKGGWIVKSYGEEAYAGFGVIFSQRAAQVKGDAKAVIADARGSLKDLGYGLVREEKGGEIIGISKGKRAMLFGGEDFDRLPKGVQILGKQVRQAAPNEHGMRMPRSSEDVLQNDYGMTLRRGKDGVPNGVVDWDGREHALDSKFVQKFENQEGGSAGKTLHRALERDEDRRNGFNPDPKFYVEPANKALGVTASDRAAGATWETAREGRVHVITRDGNAEPVPYATLMGRGDSIPVVFHNDDSRAMEKAVKDAINKLPAAERNGQMYAPDVMKTKDGWKVIELNPAAVGGGSAWLGGNPLVIDAVASHVVGREPMHAKFIGDLLRSKGAKTVRSAQQIGAGELSRQEPGAVKGGGAKAETAQDRWQRERQQEAVGNQASRPDACECNYPNPTFRNGSGHDTSCPVYQSWKAAGGFQNRDKVQGDDGLWIINAAEQPRMPAGTPDGGQFVSPGTLGATNTITHGNLKVQYAVHTTKRIDGPNIPLPNYKQHDDHSCSFVAALAAVHHFDKGVAPETVLGAVRPTKSGGMDRKGLQGALGTLGVAATYKKDLTIADLRKHVEAGTPVLITVLPPEWSSDHWTVVQGFSGDRIHLSNYKSMPIKDFVKEWYDKGEGLVCKKL